MQSSKLKFLFFAIFFLLLFVISFKPVFAGCYDCSSSTYACQRTGSWSCRVQGRCYGSEVNCGAVGDIVTSTVCCCDTEADARASCGSSSSPECTGSCRGGVAPIGECGGHQNCSGNWDYPGNDACACGCSTDTGIGCSGSYGVYSCSVGEKCNTGKACSALNQTECNWAGSWCGGWVAKESCLTTCTGGFCRGGCGDLLVCGSTPPPSCTNYPSTPTLRLSDGVVNWTTNLTAARGQVQVLAQTSGNAVISISESPAGWSQPGAQSDVVYTTNTSSWASGAHTFTLQAGGGSYCVVTATAVLNIPAGTPTPTPTPTPGSWFQTGAGDVHANGRVGTTIPATCGVVCSLFESTLGFLKSIFTI